jgi:GntR family transcriptional repressor for pyruvate dehydrogenase complex
MDKKIHDEVVTMIENLIKNGKLKAGERLPSERYLAEEFKVSRNTVREAIKALAEKAVVVSRRGAGTYIAEGALSCMIDGVTRRHLRLLEVFELRKILEPQIAGLAAQRISDETLAALEKVVQQQKKALDTGKDQVELDERFHSLIVGASGNSVLIDVYETLHDVLAESRIRELQTQERNTRSLESHRKLIRALKQRSPEKASEIMRQHMLQVEKNLEHLMNQNT